MIFNTILNNNKKLEKEINSCFLKYNRFFNLKMKPKDIPVYILKEKDMRMFYPEKWVVGFSNHNTVFVCDGEDIKDRYNEEAYISIIKHEIAHNFVGSYLGYRCYVPGWLEEGICVFLSGQLKTCYYAPVVNVTEFFDERKNQHIRYVFGGYFVKYLLEKYGKEKFLKYLKTFKFKKIMKVDKNNFEKIYKKTKQEVLKDVLKENFPKSLKEEIHNAKIKVKKILEEFFGEELCDIKLTVNKYLEKELYIKDGDNLYGFNPTKIFFERKMYISYLSRYICKQFLSKYCENENLPSWLKEGFGVYCLKELKNNNYNEQILNILDEKTSPRVKRIGGGFFIDYLFKKYKKKKFLEFLKSFKSVKTQNDINKNFKKIYQKDIKLVLKEMCKNIK